MATESKHEENDQTRARARARGRWKLLRQALLHTGSRTAVSLQPRHHPRDHPQDTDKEDEDDPYPAYSIHSFSGLNLLGPAERVVMAYNASSDNKSQARILQKLTTLSAPSSCWVDGNGLDAISEATEESLLAILALENPRCSSTRSCCSTRRSCTSTTTTPKTTRTGNHPRRSILFRVQGPDNSHIFLDARSEGSEQHLLLANKIRQRLERFLSDVVLEYRYPNDLQDETIPVTPRPPPPTTIDDEEEENEWPSTAHIYIHIQWTSTLLLLDEQYAVTKYTIFSDKDDSFGVVARERLLERKKVSLQELASHHYHQSIDNTGNICVWDSEKTLTWILSQHLQQQQQQQQQHASDKILPELPSNATILEVGAGMAGLAALSLCHLKLWNHHDKKPSLQHNQYQCRKIFITDGHPDCVRNNRINARLMEAFGYLPTATTNSHDNDRDPKSVECRLLRWSFDTCDESLNADWTLVSDCVHFQEYHGELLFTIIRNTRVGGSIWLCQPERELSLRNFLDLIHRINQSNSGGDTALVSVEERYAHVFQEKHDALVESDSAYQTSIHLPKIFILTKLRDLENADLDVIQELTRQRGS